MQLLTNKTIPIISSVIFLFTLSSCATSYKPLYSYEDYSKSYYAYKKNMTDESLVALQVSIENAINNSGESRSGRVPPGMYANLGYLFLKSNNTKEAIVNFEKEKQLYPEAEFFMNKMINKVDTLAGEQ